MNIQYKEAVSADDYNSLREAVGWEPLCREQARRGLERSAYVIGCYDKGAIAGFARIIWDGGYIAYLADVMVRPEYQGLGIGGRMVDMAIDFLRGQLKKGWRIKIVLVTSLGKEGFYKAHGFQERPRENEGPGMDLWLE